MHYFIDNCISLFTFLHVISCVNNIDANDSITSYFGRDWRGIVCTYLSLIIPIQWNIYTYAYLSSCICINILGQNLISPIIWTADCWYHRQWNMLYFFLCEFESLTSFSVVGLRHGAEYERFNYHNFRIFFQVFRVLSGFWLRCRQLVLSLINIYLWSFLLQVIR